MDNESKVTFVNSLEASGFLNGVVNLALATAQFVPEVDREGNAKVGAALVITANLRFDLFLAQQLRDRLTEILDENTKPRVSN